MSSVPTIAASASHGLPRASAAAFRGVAAVAFAAAVALLPVSAQPDNTAQTDGNARAIVADYDGIIHPIAVEFFDDVIRRADESQARVAVLTLRTPGGLLDSTRAMVSRMISSKTPVVVYVAPSGARAASAGFLIILAADVAVMAPGTHIGAAHPVAAGGDAQGGETAAKKAAADVAAYARTLAQARGRPADLAAEAVTESRAFTESEAIAADPPLIDFVARDVEDVLRQLDGRRITRFDGRALTLETSDVRIDRVAMTWRQQFLSAIAHPQLAYLMLTLGMLGLVVELWNPGAILPGVAGGLCLLLAFFAFQVIPLNLAGLLLLIFGVGLLALELHVPSFGVLGIGGIVALLIGSLMLTRDVPGVRVSYGLIIPMVIAFVGIFLFLGRLAMRAQRAAAVMGTEAMVGNHGVTLSSVGPDAAGQVRVRGEIWRALSPIPIPAGRPIRVTAVDGLLLSIEPLGAHAPERGLA